jgi:hypothetical protein
MAMTHGRPGTGGEPKGEAKVPGGGEFPAGGQGRVRAAPATDGG